MFALTPFLSEEVVSRSKANNSSLFFGLEDKQNMRNMFSLVWRTNQVWEIFFVWPGEQTKFEKYFSLAWWTTKFENYVFYRKSFSYSLAWWTNNGLKICFLWIYVQKILEKFVFFRPDWQTKFERFVFFELLYKQCSRNLIAEHDYASKHSVSSFLWPGLENVRNLFGRKAKVLHFSKLANLLAQSSHFTLSRASFTSSDAEVHLWSFSRSRLRQTWNSVARTWSSCKERRWPQPCKLFDNCTINLSKKIHLLATVEPKELGKWKLFCRIGKVKVKKSSLISDSGAQGQLLPSLCTTLSIPSLPVHLVDRLDAAQRHVLQMSVKENTGWLFLLVHPKTDPDPDP